MTNYLNNSTLLSDREDHPEIYVACLSSYVNGIHHGAWLDARQPLEELQGQIKQLLTNSPMKDAEEFAVHGYMGFGSLFIDECESIEEIHEKARFILEQGELGAELLAYYGGDLKYVKETLEEYYVGEYQSELDYATRLFDEIYLSDIPDDIQYCIDYKRFQRTIFINTYLSIEIGESCHVFRRH